VLMVGLSSGSWARVVAALPGVQRLTIVEINPGYLDLIRLYPGGSGLLDNPKVRIVIDDGRRWLLRHPEARFDAIVQNTTWHWRAHASSLLSREYFALVRSHLASGGLLYVNTTFSDAVQKTATVAFPHTLRVAGFVAASDGPFAFDKARWRGVLETLRFEGRPLFNLQRPDDRALLEKVLALADTFDGPGSEESLERDAQLRARLQGTPIVTDDNMLTEW